MTVQYESKGPEGFCPEPLTLSFNKKFTEEPLETKDSYLTKIKNLFCLPKTPSTKRTITGIVALGGETLTQREGNIDYYLSPFWLFREWRTLDMKDEQGIHFVPFMKGEPSPLKVFGFAKKNTPQFAPEEYYSRRITRGNMKSTPETS